MIHGKTTSEIVAENMKKREEEQKIAESREKIHQQQMAELEEIKKNHTTIESTAQPQYLPIETGLIGGAIGFLLGFLLAALFFYAESKERQERLCFQDRRSSCFYGSDAVDYFQRKSR